MSANLAAAFGATGFFFARPLMPWLQPGGTPAAISFYDTKHLKQTWSAWLTSIASMPG